ncbi:MAG TPA: bifunctional 5,10-methylenetetrahydrofolate dehydrogenase/5,10-methenyltetrahydrofolate cyclohydrolase [Candidatus Paceibacterota bacterium]|nr:bifunctional 5,10-methylenetetrahydrofolate dehydrogenase/5,10-methenyltetrahydrofolate cyclohydrolase [Candidatus Paceibacterota bacterium]
MKIDGRAIAAAMLAEVASEVKFIGRPLTLRAVVSEPSPATESYLRIKSDRAKDAGITLEIATIRDGAATEDLVRAVAAPGADGVIVQLPVPAGVDSEEVLNAIPLALDADVLSATAYERFARGEPGALLPPVVGAVAEILHRAGAAVAGKRAVVVGSGRLVGQPAALWLAAQGAHVATITRETGDLSMLKEADIVVAGAGSAHLIRPEHLAPGVVLIDAGTSESGGTLAGDADPACADIASVFTPVPGGVGPVAVAYLMKNVAELARLRTSA